MRSWTSFRIVFAAAASCLVSATGAYANATLEVNASTVRGWSQYHPGGGVYLTNAPGGYYMGRLFDGDRFDARDGYRSRRQLSAGPQRYFWGAPERSRSLCFWLGPRANTTANDGFVRHASGDDHDGMTRSCGRRDWPKTALVDRTHFGDRFNCPPGAEGPQLTTIGNSGAFFYYNVDWTRDDRRRRYSANKPAVEGAGQLMIPANTRIAYRYSTGTMAAIYHPLYGWGFVERSRVAEVSGLWGHEGEAWQVPCDQRPARFSLSNDDLGTIHHEFVGGGARMTPLAGDWDGDGVDTTGYFDGLHFYLSNVLVSGAPAIVTSFGIGGLPVTGDWDGDGIDTVGIFCDGRFLLATTNSPGFVAATGLVKLGKIGDRAIAGDWDGDGIDTVAAITGGGSIQSAGSLRPMGPAGDGTTLAGDWNGDGRDSTAVAGNGHFDLGLSPGEPRRRSFFIDPRERLNQYIAGDWNGDGIDTVAVHRRYP